MRMVVTVVTDDNGYRTSKTDKREAVKYGYPDRGCINRGSADLYRLCMSLGEEDISSPASSKFGIPVFSV